MTKRGIVSLGGYIPRQRLSRKAIAEAYTWLRPDGVANAKGARAIASYDEDALTMAVEAANNAIRDVPLDEVRKLFFASTSMPFSDRQNSAIIAEALSLPRNLFFADIGGSLKSGLSALRQALESGENAVVVAAEKRAAKPASAQEMSFGDGAAAFGVGDSELLAEYLGAYSVSVDMTDHYRERDSKYGYYLEDRWIRDEGYLKLIPESIAGLLKQTGVDGGAIDHLILVGPDLSAKKKISSQCGVPVNVLCDDLYDVCGDTGSAHPLVLLAYIIESASPGQLILVSGFAQGCESMLFRVAEDVGRRKNYSGIKKSLEQAKPSDDYVRYLSFSNALDLDWGIRAERDNRTAHSVFYRKRDAVTSFMGGHCTACNTKQFPQSRVCVNPDCRALDTQVGEPFKDKKSYLKSFTKDWLAHCYNPPFVYGNVAFDGGGIVMMEIVDAEDQELGVGTPLKMTFRIKDRDAQRAYHRYFWKAAVVELTLIYQVIGMKKIKSSKQSRLLML